jgi:type IV secretion system protein VirB9
MKTLYFVPLLFFTASTGAFGQAAQASTTPRPAYRNHTTKYPYGSSIPKLVCRPLRISLIVLQEGEKILSISAGDTYRWKISKSFQGSAGRVKPIIQVKPVKDDINTNIIITTNRRIYNIVLVSPKTGSKHSPFTQEISFYYPSTGISAIGKKPPQKKPTQAGGDSSQTVDISQMNTDYAIKKGKYGFPWKPSVVYDDGKHVYIKLPISAENKSLPALYVVNPAGGRNIINYSYNPNSRIMKSGHTFTKGVLILKFKHKGFLGIGTVTSEHELFITKK